MKFRFPTKECKHCCHWAMIGYDVCSYHNCYPPRDKE